MKNIAYVMKLKEEYTPAQTELSHFNFLFCEALTDHVTVTDSTFVACTNRFKVFFDLLKDLNSGHNFTTTRRRLAMLEGVEHCLSDSTLHYELDISHIRDGQYFLTLLLLQASDHKKILELRKKVQQLLQLYIKYLAHTSHTKILKSL